MPKAIALGCLRLGCLAGCSLSGIDVLPTTVRNGKPDHRVSCAIFTLWHLIVAVTLWAASAGVDIEAPGATTSDRERSRAAVRLSIFA